MKNPPHPGENTMAHKLYQQWSTLSSSAQWAKYFQRFGRANAPMYRTPVTVFAVPAAS